MTYKYKYCYIIDYSNETIHRLNLYNMGDEDYKNCKYDEKLIRDWGFNPDTCNWLFSDKELDINIINKPLK